MRESGQGAASSNSQFNHGLTDRKTGQDRHLTRERVMFRRKSFWTILIVILIAAGGGAGYYYYHNVYLPEQEPAEPTIQTAKVRRGDLVVSASGAGTLVPASEIELSFPGNGLLTELNVQIGDIVRAGDVLAKQDDTDARKAVAAAELQILQAEIALNAAQDTSAAEDAVGLAESNLAAAQLKLDEILNWEPDPQEIEQAQASLQAAQADYDAVVDRDSRVWDITASARVNLEQAETSLEAAQAAYNVAFDPAREWELSDPRRSSKLENERDAALRALDKEMADLEVAQANYNLALAGASDESGQLNAWTRVLNAQATLNKAQTAPDQAEIQAARIQVQQAEVSLRQAQANLEAGPEQAQLTFAQAELNLAAAQQDLERATLVAPMDGTIIAVAAQAGEYVGANPFITLADLSQPLVELYLDETDLDKISPGLKVEVIFDALPDEAFAGHVLRVDPVLVTVDGAPAVRGLAQLDAEPFEKHQALPAGLNAAVELIGGRAEDALLVPVEALRELTPGEYAVFVMEDGEPKLRPVQVGLMDYANAEIISGLEQGNLVSTGIVETE